jgi:hypothetical protein
MIKNIHRRGESSNWTKLDKNYFYEDYLDIDLNKKQNFSPCWVNIYF